VSLYLIRKEQDWPLERGQGFRPRCKLTFARTFANSQVRDYSWPCILVLVRDWVDESEFGRAGKPKPSEIVPKRLYLPDGRVVPVCTVLAPPLPQQDGVPVEPVTWPQATFGGGLPLHTVVQGAEHVATIGCL